MFIAAVNLARAGQARCLPKGRSRSLPCSCCPTPPSMRSAAATGSSEERTPLSRITRGRYGTSKFRQERPIFPFLFLSLQDLPAQHRDRSVPLLRRLHRVPLLGADRRALRRRPRARIHAGHCGAGEHTRAGRERASETFQTKFLFTLITFPFRSTL